MRALEQHTQVVALITPLVPLLQAIPLQVEVARNAVIAAMHKRTAGSEDQIHSLTTEQPPEMGKEAPETACAAEEQRTGTDDDRIGVQWTQQEHAINATSTLPDPAYLLLYL